MQVTYDFEPEVVRYETVKLILQPFIENVLEHAWTGDYIHIRITARLLEDALEFKIIDNGVGFPPGRVLDNTGGQDLTNAGYGIRNVDQRIKLHYGSEYGVTLFSRAGIGTTVNCHTAGEANHSGRTQQNADVTGEEYLPIVMA